jgi:hypothetical protein
MAGTRCLFLTFLVAKVLSGCSPHESETGVLKAANKVVHASRGPCVLRLGPDHIFEISEQIDFHGNSGRVHGGSLESRDDYKSKNTGYNYGSTNAIPYSMRWCRHQVGRTKCVDVMIPEDLLGGGSSVTVDLSKDAFDGVRDHKKDFVGKVRVSFKRFPNTTPYQVLLEVGRHSIKQDCPNWDDRPVGG